MHTRVEAGLLSLVLSLVTVFSTVSAAPVSARCQIANVVEIPVGLINNRLLTTGEIDWHTVRAQLDSGATLSIVAKSIADKIGIAYARSDAELSGIGRRSLEVWVGNVQTFTLGDETIKDTQLRVAQLGKNLTKQRIGSRIPVAAADEPEMLLGLDFLRAHRVLIDNTTRKMVFTYEGGPVFRLEEPAEH